MTKPTAPKKTTKKITVKEIKFWLEGITEFQSPDWVPNAEQWNTVKEKIMSLQEEPSAPVSSLTASTPVARGAAPADYTPSYTPESPVAAAPRPANESAHRSLPQSGPSGLLSGLGGPNVDGEYKTKFG